jgi:hypothetical protein
MKKALALITAACIATPALAWGDREQGALAGIFGTLIYQHLQRDGFGRQPGPVVIQQPPVIVQQPQVIYAPAPQQQVIIQNTGIVCPQGLAPFYTQRFDNYGRAYFVFDGCR